MEQLSLFIDASEDCNDQSSIIAVEEERYLHEGFIITYGEIYLGIEPGHRLMK